ncbi:hypothetical protein [Streptomyces sp. GC420]|uniref:hypothetical protein n=1 Tax=Streptomyces sp. GC420 TaxID=2697568 RepID=UPI00141505F7|nr:hypothetical protein [Streptomyces sp. GC420]NBM14444.1 hypothetical protein [Streptomyces sp. GC420]
MAMDFTSIVSAPPSGRRTALVIDHYRYTQAVILQGRPVPWDDPTAHAQYARQAQGLLTPDTTLLNLGALYDHALAADDRLRSSLSARRRTGYALKTLLADDRLAARAAELASAVSQTTGAPLTVQIPSPIRWLARAHTLSGAGSVTDLNADHGETAAMYVADWLRRLSALSVAMLLLDDRWTGTQQLPRVEDSAYKPVSNATEHYRWTLGRRTHDGVAVLDSALRGTLVPHSYWRTDAADVPTGDFLLADIPADAVPETVLSQLARLA